MMKLDSQSVKGELFFTYSSAAHPFPQAAALLIPSSPFKNQFVIIQINNNPSFILSNAYFLLNANKYDNKVTFNLV